MRKPLEDRVWGKVDRSVTGCWLWTGWICNGYASMYLEPRDGVEKRSFVHVHRLVYEWANGPIPESMVVDHLCATRACIRPDHLEAVSISENTRRYHQGPQLGYRQLEMWHPEAPKRDEDQLPIWEGMEGL